MSKFVKLLAAMGLLAGLSLPANAGLVLIIDDGTNPLVECEDNDISGCDTDADVGQISYSDTIGDWTVDFAIAESTQIDGEAELQTLLNVDYNGQDAGDSLFILVGDDSYVSPVGGGTAWSQIDGTEVGGELAACSGIDTWCNIVLDEDLTEGEEITGQIGYDPIEDTFTLMQAFEITSTGPGEETQLDATTRFTVPEPAVLGLLGLGLVGVGVARRRRKAA